MANYGSDVKATMTLDTSGFVDGIAKAQTAVSSLDESGNRVAKAFAQMDSRASTSGSSIAAAMAQAGASAEKLGTLGAKADLAQGKLQLVGERASAAAAAMSEAQAAATESAAALALLKESAEASAENLALAKEELEQLSQSTTATAAQMLAAQNAVDEFGAEVTELNGMVEKQAATHAKNEAAVAKSVDKYKALSLQLQGAQSAAGQADSRFAALTSTLNNGSAGSLPLAGLVDTIGTMGSSVLTSASRSLSSIAVNAAGLSTSTAAGTLASNGLSEAFRTLLQSASAAKLGMLGVGAAVTYGLVEYSKYKTGAYAAAAAQEEMTETAKEWQKTTAKTVYDTGNNAFGAMGVSESDFSATIGTTKDWLSSLTETWTDGKKETNEIVSSYVDAFTGGSDTIRTAIEDRKETLQGLGVTDADTYSNMQADLDQLDKWDKEIEKLLKKKKNGLLSDKETKRLETITTAKAELELEYGISDESDGFDKILQQVEADTARLAALNEAPSVDTFADGMKAASLGLNDYKQALTDSYNEQYKVIQGMEDGEAKQQALMQLNEQYSAKYSEGLQKYAETLSQLYGTVWNSSDVQNGEQGIKNIAELIQQYNAANTEETKNGVIQSLNEQLGQLDEGELTSYMAVAMQVVDLFNQGFTVEEIGELFPEINVEEMLGGYSTIAEFLGAHKGEFEGLEGIFGEGGAVPEELQRVTATLELDTKAVDDYLAEPKTLPAQLDLGDGEINNAVPVTAMIEAYEQAKTLGMPPDAKVDAVIQKYKEEGSITKVEWDASTSAVVQFYKDSPDLKYDSDKLDSLTAYIAAYDDSGAAKPTIPPITVAVNYAVEQNTEDLQSGGVQLGDVSLIDDTATKIDRLTDAMGNLNTENQTMSDADIASTLQTMQFNGDADQIVSFLTSVYQAIQQGEELSPEVQAQLESVLNFISAVDTAGLGNDLTAGIANGMQAYGFATSASTVATDLETALRTACQTHSPSTLTQPIGTDLVDGIAVGMASTASIAAAAESVGQSAADALSGFETDYTTYGENAGDAFATALRGKTSEAAAAGRALGLAAAAALKAALVIRSPSHVMRAMGNMTGEGFALGIDDQITHAEKSVSRLAGATVSAAQHTTTNNHSNAVTINLNGATIRSDNDVRTLARKLAMYCNDANYGMS